jgi:hypothetical protein
MLKRDNLQKLLTLLITWGLFLGFFLVVETYFVAGQREFLVERQFRSLAALSSELNAEFERARISTESSLRLVASSSKQAVAAGALIDCQNASNFQRCFRSFVDIYLGEVLVPGASPSGAPKCWGPDAHHIPFETIADKSRLILNVRCFSREDPYEIGKPDPSRVTPVYTLDIAPWIDRAFQQLGDPFEDVLLADASGRVLFQRSSTEPRIADLRSIVASSSELGQKQTIVASPGGSNQEHSSTHKPEQESPATFGTPSGLAFTGIAASEFEKLLVASAIRRAVIGGKNYELFSQPTRVVLGNYPEGGQIWPLVLFGVRRTSSLDSESHSMPYSTLIWLALSAIVLLSVSWPLFKLRYMSNTERFSPKDAWYLVLALFLMATATTIILLNASYLSQSRDADDDAMEQLSGKIRENLQSEMQRAFQQLYQIRQNAIFANARKSPEASGLYGGYLDAAGVAQTYPYFEIAFWANCEGQQVLKFDVRAAPTPPTNISEFSFFKSLKSDIAWTDRDTSQRNRSCPTVSAALDQINHAYLEPVVSPNTDEFAPVLAVPFAGDTEPDDNRRIVIQVLALRPISLVDPILPPSYAFAVIDAQCTVLFHSDSFRDLKENFCEESKNKTELRPWLVSGADTALDISYAGRTQRAYLTSFPLPSLASQGNAFLVVFREGDRQLTLNLAIILVCSILVAVYFLVLVAAAGLHLGLRGPLRLIYAPRIIWPCRENTLGYGQLLCANALIFLFYWASYRRLYEAPLLVLTTEVVCFSVLFGLAILSYPPRLLFRWGVLSSSIAVVTLVVIGLLHLLGLVTLDWAVLFILLAVVGLFALLVSGRISWTKSFSDWLIRARLLEFARTHFTGVYALAAVSVIVCAGVVPCLGFFKYAYDAVSEISLKYDQIVLSQRLLARRDRARGYYETLHAPEIASGRIQERLDRYDTPFYSTNCEPAIANGLSNDCTDAQKDPEQTQGRKASFTDRVLNDWIERQIARATLTFPSNETGLEMSRLGVASTNEAGAWERSWTELSPTYFQLRWKAASRLPNFTVSSSYPQWEGLTGQASVYLVLFLAGLVLWLIGLTRRIFLTKVESAPPFETVDWKAISDVKTNYLVIGSAQSGKSERLRTLAGIGPDTWRDLRSEIVAKTEGHKPYYDPRTQGVMILDHFEFDIRDCASNVARLEFIETLLYEAHSKLVIVSTIDPLYFLTEESSKVLSTDKDDPEGSRRLIDRWARVLSKFRTANLAPASKDDFLEKVGMAADRGSHYAQFAAWTFEECGGTALLRKVGMGILDEFRERPPARREQLVETVLDRAGAYYHVLWSGLTATERLVLYQLALDGWANPKNTPAIQQLERKQLICKSPMYRILNDSFCKFIQSTEHTAEIAEWEKHEQQSTWRGLRFVIIAAVIGAAVWLLYSQAQLFQIGTGYITAIATLLTALAGFSARLKRPVSQQAEASTQS